jgi:thiol-disulfide isomerase/thioredoxin
MRRRAAALVAAVLVAAPVTACGGAESWEKRCTADTNGVLICAPDQRPAPVTVTGELLDGTAYDLVSARGSVAVLNFWGSWCAPCRAEADDLETVYQATKGKGVTFLGINQRDGRDEAKAFEQGRATYPSLFDPDSRVALRFQIPPNITPATLILDRQGRVAVAIRDATSAEELRPLVENVAAEPGTS